jgi:hypothetical protein
MGSKYHYEPEGKKTEKLKSLWPENERLGIAAVIIIAVILVVSIGGYYVTGYVTYTDNLKNEKKVCDDNLLACGNNLNSCSVAITDLQTQLSSCQENANQKTTELQALLNNCTDEKGTLAAQAAAAIAGYKDLAKSSVKPICCSYSDMQTGAVHNWDILNNVVVCTGNYTINCTTGETNY